MSRPEPKQVILVRKDLKMSPGKLAAQVAHASLKVFTDRAEDLDKHELYIQTWGAARVWLSGAHTKVVLAVHSEQQLLDFHAFALRNGLHAALVRDAGRTEFNGEATYTTCAIGPDWGDDVDSVTGELHLL